MADLQRQVDELGMMVRQMQDPGIRRWFPGAVPQPANAEKLARPILWTRRRIKLMLPECPRLAPPCRSGQPNARASTPAVFLWPAGTTAFICADDDTYELHITGQLQVDYRGFPEDVDTATSPDTFLIRRARLGIEATVLKYYEFRVLPDFAGTSISKSITDAYVNVHYWDAFQVEMGKFKQPFSYEQLIQDRYTPFMERSMIYQFVPQRDEGLMIQGRKMFADHFDYAVAISNGDQNDSTIDSNNQKDFNTRHGRAALQRSGLRSSEGAAIRLFLRRRP